MISALETISKYMYCASILESVLQEKQIIYSAIVIQTSYWLVMVVVSIRTLG